MKNKVSILIYAAIIICITVMLILFSGALSGNKNKTFDESAVNDSMFIPESVVKLSDDNERLREIINEESDKIATLTEEKNSQSEQLEKYSKLAKIAKLINDGDIDGAKVAAAETDISLLDENALAIYNYITKELK